MKKKKVFLVDDHSVLRQGMRTLIGLEKDFEVCGEAVDAEQALRQLPLSEADIALLDLGLKGTNGLDLIKVLKQKMPKLLILVMSMFEESLYAERVLRAGARGYIMKSEPADMVIAALRRIAHGKSYLSPAMSERLLEKLSASSDASSPTELLSDRELEVFQALGKGLKPAEIAAQLHISVKTVETYREQIKIKLNLGSASELSQYAIAWARSERS
jgi:DNA-binding NarL/FixJ family response regulator